MKEPKNTKSIIQIQEDELEKYLKNLTFGQALQLGELGLALKIDYKNKKVLSIVI